MPSTSTAATTSTTAEAVTSADEEILENINEEPDLGQNSDELAANVGQSDGVIETDELRHDQDEDAAAEDVNAGTISQSTQSTTQKNVVLRSLPNCSSIRNFQNCTVSIVFNTNYINKQ